jgi:Raf kinase inhibitor-like YbhB/YbcL family protein
MFTLTSPAFAHEGPIPARFTCDDADRSPALEWHDPPAGTASFVLLVDDPDAPDPAAPRRLWVHWLRYNIPADIRALAEGAGNARANEGHDALTDAGTLGYHGPCPPIGRHRYYFHLHALDEMLPALGTKARRADVDAAMAGHVLATAVLMGTYARDRGR